MDPSDPSEAQFSENNLTSSTPANVSLPSDGATDPGVNLVEKDETCAMDQSPLDKQQELGTEIEHAKEEYSSEDNKVDNVECVAQIPSILYNFDKEAVPLQVTGAWHDFEQVAFNFLKGCKWAPDGSCLLTNSDDNCLRIFNLPSVFYSEKFFWNNVEEMQSVLRMKESELIYDYCWYPLMNSLDPATCCLVSSSRNTPVHMWDAFTGGLRCTYRPYNHVDEIVAPHSLAFDLEGRKLFCGFNKTIRIFDVAIPGRDCEERPTNKDKNGLPGILSCIAFNCTNDVYAVGSYTGMLGIYSVLDGTLYCLLAGQKKGVTQVMFSPNGQYLYSGARNNEEILCWDLRNPGHVVYVMKRTVTTNQRIYFDLTADGKYVVSGNQNGIVSVWDTSQPPVTSEGDSVLMPCLFYLAHYDCVNGISFNPCMPLLATSSGQRKFPDCVNSDDDEKENELILTYKNVRADNSVRLWWVGKNILEDGSTIVASHVKT